MHIIRVIVQVKPESLGDFKEIAKQEFQAVPKQFKGCNKFAWWESLANPGEFLLYEEWNDVDSFTNYKNSAYFKELGSKLFPLFSGKPDSAYYDGTQVGNG